MLPSIKHPAVSRPLLLAVLLLAIGCDGGSFVHDLTAEAGDLVKACLGRKPATRWECVKNESLAVVHQFSSAPRITLLNGIHLVRDKESHQEVTADVGKDPTFDNDRQAQQGTGSTWSGSVLNALKRLLDTHVLEIGIPTSEVRDARTVVAVRFGERHPAPTGAEGRNRRRHQMIPMMIFGVTVFGMFIIPIAFQFLTALSGKAFLMAKLALMLASINGLKRVASGGVHYGLYHAVDLPAAHAPPPLHHHHPHAHLGPGHPLLYERNEASFYGEGPRDLAAHV